MEDTVEGAPSNPGLSDPIQQRTDDIKYPAWQPECRAVMLEIDPIKAQEKFVAAEATMAERLLQIASPEDEPERRALIAEREALKLAFDEILSKDPDLNK